MTLKERVIQYYVLGIGYLPLWLARALGYLLGSVAFLLPSRFRDVTRKNLELVYPDSSATSREQLARSSMKQTCQAMFEMPVVWNRSMQWLQQKTFTIHGEDLLKQAVAEGKGVIIIAPHIGNWEVLGLSLSRFGPVTSLYQPPDNAALESVVKRGREKSGARLMPTTQRGVAAVLRALRLGEITGILPDQVPDTQGGDFAPFFNQQAFTMTLIYNLIQKTGATALLGYAKRVPGGFEMVFAEAPKTLYSADQAESLSALNAMVEQSIADVPEQYQWEYKRFKKQPPPLHDPY